MTTKRRKTRRPNASEGSKSRRENSEQIPVNIIIEILLGLPAKSVGRCCCVSKLWASLPRRSDFMELFLTRSSSRPQLLFACQKDGGLFFFSSPQPQNPDENSSLVASAGYHMKLPDKYMLERKFRLVGVTNTKRFETGTGVSSYFGYDPIEKQYKVLCMTYPVRGEWRMSEEQYQVLTLAGEELSWRRIKCSKPHYPIGKRICISGICINGVLYYPAYGKYKKLTSYVDMLVCFDVRSESFSYIKVKNTLIKAVKDGTLINYNGKLGAVLTKGPRFNMWVLEDIEKEEWSEHTFVLPPSCQYMIGNNYLSFVGVTCGNEIVLSLLYKMSSQNVPYYIYYYNVERKVYTFVDHVENVKRMEMFST
ncbi:unnamed protein product [Microthlaspi erraticum]|uniref:F-box domain-containing protein n=1 Tax=Microthlaspi erraticum TaxID=1685480 RepID=A0A6D2KQ35_9BRAS|nr:unnamed protein product [Microthlaspi erraticum]CAA7049603.1 unnamed protein product [Microthlaspi erraticum]